MVLLALFSGHLGHMVLWGRLRAGFCAQVCRCMLTNLLQEIITIFDVVLSEMYVENFPDDQESSVNIQVLVRAEARLLRALNCFLQTAFVWSELCLPCEPFLVFSVVLVPVLCDLICSVFCLVGDCSV